MKKKDKRKKEMMINHLMRARLSFDEGYAERPIYSIKGFTTEKDKGISMIDLIKRNFNLSDKQCMDNVEEQVRIFSSDRIKPTLKDEKPQFLRDERGQIISPFGAKAKEMKEKDTFK